MKANCNYIKYHFNLEAHTNPTVMQLKCVLVCGKKTAPNFGVFTCIQKT